jgi:hypothetical protein
VAGKFMPDTVKPAPEIAAELTVSGALPVEDRVTVWVTGVFTATLPKATLPVLMPSAGAGGAANCSAKLAELLPELAARVAD